MSKHFITGLASATGPYSMTAGGTANLGYGANSFDRANGLLCGLSSREMCGGEYAATAAVTGTLQWQSTNTAVASVTTPGLTTTATGVAVGTAEIVATPLAVSAYDLATDRIARRPMTVTAAPPPPPSGITATAITSNSATVNWTTGNSSATTVIEYQRSGDATWAQTSAAAGATSKTLTGLQASSTYSVRLHHVLNGVSSTTVTASNLFQTAAVALSVTLAADHDGAMDQVGSNQTCRWKAFSNITGATWNWQQRTAIKPFWMSIATTQIVSVSTGTSTFDLRVIGTAATQADTVSMSVAVSAGGPVCGAW
jgi:hypothetical protein